MRAPLVLPALLALASGAAIAGGSSGNRHHVLCYYGSWAVYRPGDGKYDVENIDPFLCTHHIYTFAGLDNTSHTIMSLDPYNDLYDNYGKGAYIRFTNMKQRNPALKTILAIGGWTEGSEKYSYMAASPETRQTFIQSCVAFVKKYNFDGLDLDWEYPAERGGKPIDKTDYVMLIKEMKAAFASEGLLLSAAVGPGKATIDDSYHLSEMGQYLDIVSVMAYDYHGSWDPFTGHVAPLYLSPLDIEHGDPYQYYSVNFTVNYYLDGGIPAEKVAMGIPLYGHGFTLSDPAQHGLYAPAPQPQPACPYTQQAGVCGFNEICTMLKQSGWTSVRDADQQAIYSYNNNIWVGYDDLESIKLKTDYIQSLGLGGSMVWSIETDDFHNLCGFGTSNPLMTAIWTALNGDIPGPTTPATTTPGPTKPTTSSATTKPGPNPTSPPQPGTTSPSPVVICQHEGINPDPSRACSPFFYECTSAGDHWDVTQEQCPVGTVFNPEALTCAYPWETPGCQ